MDFWPSGASTPNIIARYGIAARRIFPVPYAVDNSFFRPGQGGRRGAGAPAARLGLEPDRPIILYASKLSKIKRGADLLEAYIRMSPDQVQEPYPYLVFIGDGDQRQILERARRGDALELHQVFGIQKSDRTPGIL